MATLIRCTILDSKQKSNWVWKKRPDNVYGIVLNSYHMSDLKATEWNNVSGYCTFRYSTRWFDRKEPVDEIVVDASLTTIQNACETATITSLMYLPVYENDDITTTPVTHYMPYNQVSFLRADDRAPDTRSWIYFTDSNFRLRRYLIGLSLDEVVDYANTTSTTLHTTYADQ
jgi:hypothetical protein